MMFAFVPFLLNPIMLPPEKRRRFDCERLSAEEARVAQPSAIPPEKPRGSYVERSLLHCRARLLQPGTRSSRADGLLYDLEAQAVALAEAAARRGPGEDYTWVVEVNVPTADVVPKVGFALKAALMRAGLSVSDRVPVLSAGDIDVITRMEPMRAYPSACQRYADTSRLRDTDVLLYAMVLDPRETQLHAGMCLNGGWTWLR